MELLIASLTTLLQILVLSLLLFESTVLSGHFIQHGVDLKYATALGLACMIIVVHSFIVYPLLLDPLRKFPVVDINDARVFLTFTDVPRGDPALEWTKQHPGHDALRVRVNYLTTVLTPVSPKALRDVLSTHQQDFEKPLAGRNHLSQILGYGLILSEGNDHARQRRQLTPHFRIQNIRALHGLMLAKADLLLKKMKQESETLGRVEVCSWASKATLDIIGATLMSKDFNSLEVPAQPESDAFAQLTEATSGQMMIASLSLVLPRWLLLGLPTSTNRMMKRNKRLLRNTCETALSELHEKEASRQNDIDSSDILSSLVRDHSIPRQELIDQMITFLGAGHETTAASIAWVTHLLTLPENRRYQDLLRDEIARNPNCTSSPTELEKLPWLNAICEETLRLFPPVTVTARKAIRDTMIADTKVPKHTVVTLFPWATNRNPDYWGGTSAIAERFMPGRWIDTLPDGRTRVNKHGGARSNYCELTFLHGNRSCIGQDFAKAELRCIVARMFGEFVVERLPGDDGHVTPSGSITIKPAEGLFVKLTRA